MCQGLGGVGKRKLITSSCFEREIQKLECLINCHRSPMIVKGRGRSNGDQALVQ